MKSNEAHAQFPTHDEVRLTRLLPGPIERVWDYITDSEKRSRWFCGGELEQKAGGKFVFAMRHKNLSPDEIPPAKYAHVQDPGVTFEGRVLRCEAPNLLIFTFGGDDSQVTFELIPQGKQVLLVVTHRTTSDDERAELPNYASGWHTHIAQLIALLEGNQRPKFWATHAKLLPEYEQLYSKTPQS